jgi:hypothetical protein
MEAYEAKSLVFQLGGMVEALIEMQGMIAANKERESQGYALAYSEEAFMELIKRQGLGHNQRVTNILQS